MDFKDFAKLISEEGKMTPVRARAVVKDYLKAYAVTVIEHTPVDTGRAVSNWLVGVGTAPTEYIPAHVPGTKGSTAGVNAATAVMAAIEKITPSKPGQRIYIRNNTPYIEDLDNGSSIQAPGGMTALASAVAESVARASMEKWNADFKKRHS